MSIDFTSEQKMLLDQAKKVVAELQLKGLPMDLIKELITDQIQYSRLLITKKNRIYLVDYNNKEVTMGPLPKTVFLFFLKHDKEFMLSELMYYKQELLSIYEKVSNRGDKEKMIKSIEALIDPTSNSICEKFSAIKKAFLDILPYNIANSYFIDGKQGMSKKILLDRALVEWQYKI